MSEGDYMSDKGRRNSRIPTFSQRKSPPPAASGGPGYVLPSPTNSVSSTSSSLKLKRPSRITTFHDKPDDDRLGSKNSMESASREGVGHRPGFLSRMMKGRGTVGSEESEMPRETRGTVEEEEERHTPQEHMHECEAMAEGEEGHGGLQQGNGHEGPQRGEGPPVGLCLQSFEAAMQQAEQQCRTLLQHAQHEWHNEEDGQQKPRASRALQTVVEAHTDALLSSLCTHLPPSQASALRDCQREWLGKQEAAILASCQAAVLAEEGEDESGDEGTLTPVTHPATPSTSFQDHRPSTSSSYSAFPSSSAFMSAAEQHPPVAMRTYPNTTDLLGAHPSGRPPSGLSSPARSVASAASSFSRGGHLSRLQEEVNGALDRTWAAFQAATHRAQSACRGVSPWGEGVVLGQAQRRVRDTLLAFTENVLVVTSVRLQTEYERRRKAERSLARTRAEVALMAETIEKERGRGGGEAMLRVANLEEQLRQMEALVVRLRKEVTVARDRELKALQAQAEAERRMAGGGPRRRGGGSGEGEDDDEFSDAHALSAHDINSLCDKLLKAQEEALHWRGRCMHLEALQIMPSTPLRTPPTPAAAAPTSDGSLTPLSTGPQEREAGPSGNNAGGNVRQPPSPTAAAGGAANNGALGRPPRPEALQRRKDAEGESKQQQQIDDAIRAAVGEERERQLKVLAGMRDENATLSAKCDRLDKANRRLLLTVKKLQHVNVTTTQGLPPPVPPPGPLMPAAAAPPRPPPPAASVPQEGGRQKEGVQGAEGERARSRATVLRRAKAVVGVLLVLVLAAWCAFLLASNRGEGWVRV